MLRTFSDSYLTPDDLSVPCRIRRCEESSSSDEDGDNDQTETRQQHQHQHQPEDMTCTMRKWHRETTTSSEFMSPLRRKSSKCQTKIDDTELILTPAYVHRRRCLSGEQLSKIADTNTPIPLSKRFASFGTPDFIAPEDVQNSRCETLQERSGFQPQFREEITIPVKDIIKVLTRAEDDGKQNKQSRKKSSEKSKMKLLKEECRQQPTICITTSSSGSYELLMESTNEQLVLVTFLKVNSTKGKISFVTETKDEINNSGKRDTEQSDKNKTKDINNKFALAGEFGESKLNDAGDPNGMEEYQSMVIGSNPSNLTNGTTPSNRSFDVETFTAKRMNERLNTESLPEKVERRMHRLISSLGDLSSSFNNCACGCFGDSTVDNTIVIKNETGHRPRKKTASTISLSDNDKLEVDPALSTEDSSVRLLDSPAAGENYYVELMCPSPMPLTGLSPVMASDI